MANIFIYGSCVSRDAYNLIKDHHNLVAYVARQAIISATSPATDLLDGNPLGSKFQNRMLNGDLRSDLFGKLRRFEPTIDSLIMDLTDERLGIIRLPDGAFITRSRELISSQRLESLSPAPGVIRMGSQKHWDLWEHAARVFVAELDHIGLTSRVTLLDTPWATKSTTGDEMSTVRGVPIDEMNKHFNRMVDLLRKLGLKVSRMPSEFALTTSEHRWGQAPYHYAEVGTRWIADQISSSY